MQVSLISLIPHHNAPMQDLKTLIEKYNKPGPRYTSYPPVPFWNPTPPSEGEWITHLKAKYNTQEGIDLYVHVPYCEKLCYYCGCNRTITKDHSLEDPYLGMIIKEWEIYKKHLGLIPKVNSLHFGGGTPTFLSADNLRTLIQKLTVNKMEQFIGSIEIDPRTCQEAHLNVLSELGIQRVSLGIQDFDPEVQRAINRDQSVKMVELLMEKLRKYEFQSINFDLIYGLPKQTLKSISATMEVVARLRPDLIAFYGYAHLPGKIKNQRLIHEDDLPSAEERKELYESGKKILKQYGYEEVGMDHFALSGSYLLKAKNEGKLHRNFMGYVDKKSSILIGLGPTSISDSSQSFIQNAKSVSAYEEAIKKGVLAIASGHTHSADDLSVQDLILNLMCRGEVEIKKSIPYLNEVEKELASFEEDGVLTRENNFIRLSPVGKGFVRNVAMSFDFHLREQKSKARFSQTI